MAKNRQRPKHEAQDDGVACGNAMLQTVPPNFPAAQHQLVEHAHIGEKFHGVEMCNHYTAVLRWFAGLQGAVLTAGCCLKAANVAICQQLALYPRILHMFYL